MGQGELLVAAVQGCLPLIEQLVEQLCIEETHAGGRRYAGYACAIHRYCAVLSYSSMPGAAETSVTAAPPARAAQSTMPSSNPRSRTPARSPPTGFFGKLTFTGTNRSQYLQRSTTATDRTAVIDDTVAALHDLGTHHAHSLEEESHQQLEGSGWKLSQPTTERDAGGFTGPTGPVEQLALSIVELWLSSALTEDILTWTHRANAGPEPFTIAMALLTNQCDPHCPRDIDQLTAYQPTLDCNFRNLAMGQGSAIRGSAHDIIGRIRERHLPRLLRLALSLTGSTRGRSRRAGSGPILTRAGARSSRW